jgi:hypothetical protein
MDDVDASTRDHASEIPAESIARLKATHAAAQQAYLTAAPGDDLTQRAASAEATSAGLRDDLRVLNPDHVAAARAILDGPAGADRATWTRAAEQAQQDAQRLQGRHAQLQQAAAALGSQLQTASPGEDGRVTWIQLPEQWRPSSAEDGAALRSRAEADHARLQGQLEGLAAKTAQLDRQLTATRQSTAQFASTIRLLNAVQRPSAEPPASMPISPFAGTAEAADQAAQDVIDQLIQTRDVADVARERETAAHTELITFARQQSYERMSSLFRTALLNSTADIVAARAAEWSQQLDARRVSLETDLGNSGRHRAAIIDRLAALVDQALKTLRRAAHLSRLPEDLPDWAGRESCRSASPPRT